MDRELRRMVGVGVAAAVMGLAASNATAGHRHDEDDREMPTLEELDLNADGLVNADEIVEWMESRRSERVQRIIDRADDDGDGMLNADELANLDRHRGFRRHHWD